jgi:acetoin utilization protein AcuB
MLVKNHMTRGPVAVTPESTLADALRLTRQHRIRHLPVVRGEELAGVLSDRDIRLAMPSPLTVSDPERAAFLERTPVGEMMTREVITAGPLDTVEDAAKLMRRHRVGCLPVVSATGALLGILTETDILHVFAELLDGGQPSSRLEVAMPDRPGELARVVRIVGEELKLNLTGVLVPPVRRRRGGTVILHVNTIDPREAIHALEAAGYRVGWPSLEADLRRGMEE